MIVVYRRRDYSCWVPLLSVREHPWGRLWLRSLNLTPGMEYSNSVLNAIDVDMLPCKFFFCVFERGKIFLRRVYLRLIIVCGSTSSFLFWEVGYFTIRKSFKMTCFYTHLESVVAVSSWWLFLAPRQSSRASQELRC